MQDTLSLFSGKRVLVTGDTGFKGSWLSYWLYLLGAEVAGYALPPERENDLFNLLGLERLIHHVTGDIRHLEDLERLFREFQPEIVFHLAAQALVRLSYDQPRLTFETNVGGSVNVLEAIRANHSVRVVIFVTSDKCYRNKEWIWGYRENDELGGRDPYSASKAAAEMVFAAYHDSFFLPRQEMGFASVRAGNILGGGDWAVDRLVPDIMKALIAGKPIVLRNPQATRPWQHVLDPLAGYLLLATQLYHAPKSFNGSWNFGPTGEAIQTVLDLTEKIVAHWGSGSITVEKPQDASHEAGMLHLNCDKARRLLGWEPKWAFDKTIKETVLWYRNIMAGESAKSWTERQIKIYMG